MTDNEIVEKSDPRKEFEDKLLARLTQDIGELLPDGVLVEMIERAMEDAFFKERTITETQGYSSKEVLHPPWFVEVIQDITKDTVEKKVREWIVNNVGVLEKAVTDTLSEGILKHAISVLDERMSNLAGQMVQGLRDDVANNRITYVQTY